MANYAMHIGVGTVVSGALATLTLAADVVGHESLIAVTLAGVVGSVLPDIDLKDSRASVIFFSAIAVFASFCVLFLAAMHFSIAELWLLWLGSLVFVRYGLHSLFHHTSVHRGIWHSLLAAVFCSALTAIFFKHALHKHEGVAWLGAGFMFVGYITHLVLDEIYSVDFMGRRIKASFGTAMKLVDGRRPMHTAAMAVATIAVLLVTPSPVAFVDHVASRDMWSGLRERLLPEEHWFGIISKDGRLVFDDLVEHRTAHPPIDMRTLQTGTVEPATVPAPSDPAQSDPVTAR